ncbi:hypothetical protein Tco_0837932 [Tanacetum coccineum]
MAAQELSPTDSLMQDDSIPDEQVLLSDDEDSRNDHLPKADFRQDWWKPLTLRRKNQKQLRNHLDHSFFRQVNRHDDFPEMMSFTFSSKWRSVTRCSQIRLTGRIHKNQYRINVNRPLPLGGPLDHDSRVTQKECQNTLADSQLSSELKAKLKIGYDILEAKLSSKTITKNIRLLKRISRTSVVFPVNNNERRIMRFNEIYKFSDSTLTRILETLDYRVKEFKIKRLNPGMNTRFYTKKDVTRSKEFITAIERRLKTRRIYQKPECFVSGRVHDIDYRLL